MPQAKIVVRDAKGETSKFDVEQSRPNLAERIVREGVCQWQWCDKVKHEVSASEDATGQRVVVQLLLDRNGEQVRAVTDAARALGQLLEGRGLRIHKSVEPDYGTLERHAELG